MNSGVIRWGRRREGVNVPNSKFSGVAKNYIGHIILLLEK